MARSDVALVADRFPEASEGADSSILREYSLTQGIVNLSLHSDTVYQLSQLIGSPCISLITRKSCMRCFQL